MNQLHEARNDDELSSRIRVLFLCTGNSCRSQMAEGWTRALKSKEIVAFSAGTNPQGINKLAARVMWEVGVDISKHTSKHVDSLTGINFDYVVTVCDAAHEACPLFPSGAKIVHIGFEDPPKLAKQAKTEEEALVHYRRVRDEIKACIETLPGRLERDKDTH